MTDSGTVHAISVPAPADDVFRLVANVEDWPLLFEPTLRVKVLDRQLTSTGQVREQLRIWAMVNGEIRNWISFRELDSSARSISFRQNHAHPPLSRMGGAWRIFSENSGTRVELSHHFTLQTESAETRDWVLAGIDENSQRELHALKRVCTGPHRVADLLVETDDRLEIPTNSRVFDFIRQADLWPTRLPHVASVDVDQLDPSTQRLEMTVDTGDGANHTTTSIRLLRPSNLIVYKQVKPPKTLLGHYGEWIFQLQDGQQHVVSRHRALLNPDCLLPHETLADARERIAELLVCNSRRTLECAVADIPGWSRRDDASRRRNPDARRRVGNPRPGSLER
jgi:aromatase